MRKHPGFWCKARNEAVFSAWVRICRLLVLWKDHHRTAFCRMHSICRWHQENGSMDIDSLQTFVAIAELGGFTRAGARLHRSQPAISRRLGLLEQELGAPLFERLRGRARLTEAGRTFRPHAEAALAALKDGRDAVRDLQSGLRGTLSLALVGTLADTRIVDSLRRFRRRARDVTLELRTASSAEVTNLVRRGEVTLGLRYGVPEGDDLALHPAGEEALLVVA